MLLQELNKYVDVDLRTLMGEFKLNLIGGHSVMVQNFIKMVNYTSTTILLKIKNNEVVIEGENFKIAEMGVHDAIITGKINKIEYKR